MTKGFVYFRSGHAGIAIHAVLAVNLFAAPDAIQLPRRSLYRLFVRSRFVPVIGDQFEYSTDTPIRFCQWSGECVFWSSRKGIRAHC